MAPSAFDRAQIFLVCQRQRTVEMAAWDNWSGLWRPIQLALICWRSKNVSHERIISEHTEGGELSGSSGSSFDSNTDQETRQTYNNLGLTLNRYKTCSEFELRSYKCHSSCLYYFYIRRTWFLVFLRRYINSQQWENCFMNQYWRYSYKTFTFSNSSPQRQCWRVAQYAGLNPCSPDV